MPKDKKKKAETKESKSETLRKMREASAKGGKESAKKEAKPKVETGIIHMKGYEVLPPLKMEERKETAKAYDAEFRAIEKDVRIKSLRAAILLREMKGYELWKELPAKSGKAFNSFDAWLREAAPVSRSGAYAALKMADKLLPYIPKDELAAMPDYARRLLANVPKFHLEKVDSPIRKAARESKSQQSLTKEINKHAPEAHIEQKRTIQVPASSAAVIADFLEACVLIGEVSPNEAFEFGASDWLDSHCSREGMTHMSNREAWQVLKEAKEKEEAEVEQHQAAQEGQEASA